MNEDFHIKGLKVLKEDTDLLKIPTYKRFLKFYRIVNKFAQDCVIL